MRACAAARRPAHTAWLAPNGRVRLDARASASATAAGCWTLTRYEYRLLAALLPRPGAILSREQLMDDVCEAPGDSDRTVDTHVKTLRAKLRSVDRTRPDPDPSGPGLPRRTPDMRLGLRMFLGYFLIVGWPASS